MERNRCERKAGEEQEEVQRKGLDSSIDKEGKIKKKGDMSKYDLGELENRG